MYLNSYNPSSIEQSALQSCKPSLLHSGRRMINPKSKSLEPTKISKNSVYESFIPRQIFVRDSVSIDDLKA